ncbi:hypothetical protein [Pararhizobium sp.]|uniref:hypothetical protein n=1 Tax=Pararhizobium sp. TaxID=1977563 RepID=UPI0027270C02|nr:hypothetical protein [Pararhizobium sp.]MDO9414701.1 hypothetical protein [Pararhizobium sp.]
MLMTQAEARPYETTEVLSSSMRSQTLGLYRLASVAGLGSALILLVNAAKRSGLIAASDLTQILAPLAEILALGAVTGLFFAAGRRAGLFGTIAFAVNFVALASLVGVEMVINLVFSKLPMPVIAELLAGPLGLVFKVSSMLFLIASLAFVLSLIIAKGVPRIPLVLYAISATPIALRAFVPEWLLDLGLAGLAVALVWLSVCLWRGAAR